MSDIALAIDPGTRKCGIAVVQSGVVPRTLYRKVIATPNLCEEIPAVLSAFPVSIVLIGDSTNAHAVASIVLPLLPPLVPVEFVAEAFTSERARTRWCQEHPPTRLWERLLPGFRTPPEPVDDYAAAILAEQYFATKS